MVGFGTMGSGIAQVFAMNGFQVNVFEVSKEAIARGMENVKKSLLKFQEKGQLREDPEEVLSRIRAYSSLPEAPKEVVLLEAIYVTVSSQFYAYVYPVVH
ncbi:MAG: 3-hydroxyacyl-CoA dehydrogenase NAD-binding domain-containing protein [Candidatus Aramenus sulfurataquae]|uniref:3-hydroxyacyl-CoA dehydrogenase NAD-binding domain-containing protein n=1 Tax=Candidatus Aramenus sulfurataquae TaxID=1326980 RepID=A0ACC6TQ93_9CREN